MKGKINKLFLPYTMSTTDKKKEKHIPQSSMLCSVVPEQFIVFSIKIWQAVKSEWDLRLPRRDIQDNTPLALTLWL